MHDLILHKKNEAYIQFECERSLAQELSDFFTFYVPGYQFTPAFKNRLWDGKIRLADLRSFTIYHGLVSYIENFCKERDYTLHIENSIINTEVFSAKEAMEFIETLNLPHQIRDYQFKSFITAIRNKRMLIVSPTASGKSLILYVILRYIQLIHNSQLAKGLLIVPTTALCYQMYNDFKDYSINDENFNVEDDISIIMAGKDKNPKKDRIKVLLENDKTIYLKPNQKIKTKRGVIFAKNLSVNDEIL